MAKNIENNLDGILKKVYNKSVLNVDRMGNSFMNYSENGIYLKSDKFNWTCGFFAGMLWLLGEEYKNKEFFSVSIETEKKLDAKLDGLTTLNHDVGFMWLLTAGIHYRIDKNEDSRLRLLKAATVLASRFNPMGGFIKAWNKLPGKAIVDCMMNIPILYEMTRLTGEVSYKNIAVCHADMVMNNLVHSDGSVSHIAQFNPETGEFLGTRQGAAWSAESAWSRGCAWVIYGFTISYYYTKKTEYLKTAKLCADYFLDNLNEYGVSPYDFKAPDKETITDTSAAAIAASGMITLAELSECKKYFDGACRILEGLTAKYTDFSEKTEPILTGATVERHVKGIMTGIIYADYYYTEALIKLKNKEFFLPWTHR